MQTSRCKSLQRLVFYYERMRPASVSPAARRPPPWGKVLGQWNWVDAVENTRGRRGHAPALRTVYVPFSKRLSVNESGDPPPIVDEPAPEVVVAAHEPVAEDADFAE